MNGNMNMYNPQVNNPNIPQNTQPMNNPNPYQTNMQYNNQTAYNQKNNIPNNQKKSKLPIIIGILLVVIIAAVAVFLLMKKNDKKEEKKEPEKQENNTNTNQNTNTNTNITISWSGTYENSDGTITIYQYSNEKLYYGVSLNSGSAFGSAEISGNKAEGKIFDTYTFTLEGTQIQFTTTDEDLKAGTFTKKGDYSKEDYYKDNFGDPSYLNTNVNGIFQNGDITIKIYQTSETAAMITITASSSIYSTPITINNGSLVLDKESFGETEKINITISSDSITVVASSSDTSKILNKISGSYKKVKPYTIDDILADVA